VTHAPLPQVPYGVPPPGFRAPADAHIGAVHLQVGSLQRSLDYYTQVIGSRVHGVDGPVAALAPHGDDRVLVWLHEKPGASRSPRRGVYGLFHFAILVPDRASLGRFLTHLSRLDVRIGSADHLVSEALYLWDPDGLGIEVYADRPRAEWRHDGRQLLMATDPLDVASLMAAGGTEAWGGMPRGTTIGHVHLHVGDIAAAERFYHLALGLDKTQWTYPGALFLSAGGYHHHLGTNTWAPGPSASPDQARLLEWELVMGAGALAAAARSLAEGGYEADVSEGAVATADPWGTRLRITA
jgi:catechol 2,3-dioxygenase